MLVLYTRPKALETQNSAHSCHKRLDEGYLRRLWSGSSINQNKELVEHLKASKKVAEVLESIDRALFVPDGNAPFYDTPIPIGYINATISAPHMHATSLQLLEENLQPGMHALDVGSGTGYLTTRSCCWCGTYS